MKTWNNLSKRERYAVFLALGSVVSFLIIRLAVFPLLDKRSRSVSIIQAKKKTFSEMVLLREEHRAIQGRIRTIEKTLYERSKNFTLFSFLEDVASGIGIKERIAYLKPAGTVKTEGPYRLASIEAKLESISTEALVSFLYQVETSSALTRVRRVSISKTGNSKGFVDVVFQIETLEL